MARVKRGVTAGRRHKKVLGKAKGYYNARRKVYRAAKQAVIKAGQYAYRDRRQKKREFRALWIARINAAARLYGLSYSRMINGLSRPASRSTARCSPTSPCTIRRRLARSRSRPRPLSASADRSVRLVADLTALTAQALGEIAACGDLAALEEARVRWLGKKGTLTEQLKALAALSAAERPAAGARSTRRRLQVQARYRGAPRGTRARGHRAAARRRSHRCHAARVAARSRAACIR